MQVIIKRRFPPNKQSPATIVGKAMEQFYDIEGKTLEDAYKILKPLEPYLKIILEKSQEQSPDSRPGSETYGFDCILGDLFYISDRWRATFRIRWILDTIKYLDKNLLSPN